MTSTHNSPVTNLECQQHSILKWVMNACSGALSAPDVAKLGRHHSARQHTVSKYLTLVRFCQFMINLTEMWSFYIGNIINANIYLHHHYLPMYLVVGQIRDPVTLDSPVSVSSNTFSNKFSSSFSNTFSNNSQIYS